MIRLLNATEEGNIDGLYAAIGENPHIFDQIEEIPFADTPLHGAAFAGHIQYAMEIMRLRPSFARKSNQKGFTPIQIAFQKEHIQLVLGLVDMDSDLVQIKGREGLTPLHYAAENGNRHLLARFLSVCPKSIGDVNIRNETALHIALKTNKREAFEFLVDRLHWDCHEEARYWEKRILNRKDVEGNTVLHIATSRNQPHLVGLLIGRGIDVNAKNVYEQTALDIAEINRLHEISHLLRDVGAARASSLSADNTIAFLRTDQRLNMAAEQGDIIALYSIIREDPYLLERIENASFIDTPLHISASKGHTQFALEIMWLKPSLAKKPNQDGFSPLHLALQNEQFQTVRGLLDADRNLLSVKGRAGQTPLHYVAERGNLDLLTEFLRAYPKSIQDLTIYKETALHVAAKKDMWEAFGVLCGWLQLTGQNAILNCTDDEGNSVLHIATSKNQIEASCPPGFLQIFQEMSRLFHAHETLYLLRFVFVMQAVKLLIGGKVDLNIKNMNGNTALDVLYESQTQMMIRSKIRKILCRAGALRSSSIPHTTTVADNLSKKRTGLEIWALSRYREKLIMSDQNRNAILVVAVLIATATYQAVLSPPGGVWQGDPTLLFPNTDSQSRYINAGAFVGRPVMFDLLPLVWYLFSVLNTAAFILSIGIIYNLLPRRPLIVLPLVIPLFLCYGISWYAVQTGGINLFIVGVVIVAILILLFRGFIAWFQKAWRDLVKLMAHNPKI
ncbi:uncharacterized protein LOC110660842 [Hevea brasiliensis]|uniref:uncharacterized protein LOC110660842 n=1 Tax=Hevea brasiliensis TaxID=3981 RepID=UPI0025DB7FCA|nr:uncharacterized protein LOC110660842 [Hevea brasiliensis]